MRIAGRKPGRRVGRLDRRDRRPRRPARAPSHASSRAASSSASPRRGRSRRARRSSSPTSRPARSTRGPAPSCSRFLRTAVDDLGQTVVMVTHDPSAAAYADRVLFLADGRIADEMHRPSAEAVLDYMKTWGPDDVDRNLPQHGGAQAAPRPHDGVDRPGRRPALRHADPHQHDGDRLRHALRQDRVRHRRGGPHRGAVHPDRGRRHRPRPDRGRRARPGPRRRRRPRGRGVGAGLRPADRHRRPRDHHQRWRADQRLQHAGRRGAPRRRRAALRARARPAATRSPSTRPAPRSTTSRSARPIKVLFQGPTREFTVVGTVGYGDGITDLGGTTSAYFDTATAQQVLGDAGHLRPHRRQRRGRREPDRAGRPASRRCCPRAPRRSPARPWPRRTPTATKENFAIVGIIFGIFAGIALFVGSFIIWNTFTMTVTQRSREIALLRAIGARRRQVLGSLLLEAVGLGLLASAAGFGLGVAVAKGLKWLMDAVGLALPFTSLQLEASQVWISLAVGVGVTVMAALVPARRATKVLPIEALRESAPGARAVVGAAGRDRAVVLGAGVGRAAGRAVRRRRDGACSASAWPRPWWVWSSRCRSRCVRWRRRSATPLRLRGLPGELAKQNATRNPRRTSATAAALMIGLTLVVSMGVFASSLKASFGDVLGDQVDADLYVVAASAQAPGYSPSVVDEVAGVDGVDQVSATGWGKARFAGWARATRHRPGQRRRHLEPEGVAGLARGPGRGRRHGLGVGGAEARLGGGRPGARGVRASPASTRSRSRRSTAARAGSATTTSSAAPRRRRWPVRSWSARRFVTLERGRRPGHGAGRASTTALADRAGRQGARPGRASRRRPAGSSTSCSPS